MLKKTTKQSGYREYSVSIDSDMNLMFGYVELQNLKQR